MSLTNESNRPDVPVRLGNVNSTGSYSLLPATKKLLVRRAYLVLGAEKALTAAAFWTLRLKKVSGGAEQDGFSADVAPKETVARGEQVLLGSDVVLEAGESLTLDVTKTGSAPNLTDSVVVLDVEVCGS